MVASRCSLLEAMEKERPFDLDLHRQSHRRDSFDELLVRYPMEEKKSFFDYDQYSMVEMKPFLDYDRYYMEEKKQFLHYDHDPHGRDLFAGDDIIMMTSSLDPETEKRRSKCPVDRVLRAAKKRMPKELDLCATLGLPDSLVSQDIIIACVARDMRDIKDYTHGSAKAQYLVGLAWSVLADPAARPGYDQRCKAYKATSRQHSGKTSSLISGLHSLVCCKC